MLFFDFAKVLQKIDSTTLRNQITVDLADLFSRLEKEEIEPACWLLLGRIMPPYEGLEFQFAEKMMARAIAEAFATPLEEVTRIYKEYGDLSRVAMEVATLAKVLVHQQHTVSEIFSKLRSLAEEGGEGSQERKVKIVVELLGSLDPLSVRYVVRIVLTKLRLGFSDMTMLDALSWAIKGDKSDRKILEDAYQNKHDIGKLALAYLTKKEEGIAHFDIELGIPIQPALCQRLRSPQEMIEKMGKVFVESKYDGTRVQIHIRQAKNGSSSKSDDWRVRTFTRSLEESSAMFPELEEWLAVFGAHDLILDSEAIGFDPTTGKLLAFQETIQRKRKHDVGEFSKKIPLKFFVFDILYLDGKRLLSEPLSKRKDLLHQLFGDTSITTESSVLMTKSFQKGVFVESSYIVTESPDELRDYHKKQLDYGLEGAVIKQYDSVYQPGRKGWSWVKFKEEEDASGKLSDTIDAVVMGYWYGKGKRNQFGIGAFLIGVMGKDEQILTLTKVGTGLTDEQWRELKKRCELEVVDKQPTSYVVAKALVPDVWVDPKIVVEVAGDELTKSPNHSAGLALRFPRLVNFRDDKKVSDITTTEELESIK